MAVLAEDLLLLAFDEDRPTEPAHYRGHLTVGLVAALLGDLSLLGRARISEATVRVLDTSPTDDTLLDEVLHILASTRQLFSPGEWLNGLPRHLTMLEERLVDRLVARGSLRRTLDGFVATQQLPLPPELQAIEERRMAGAPISADERERLVTYLGRRRRGLLVQRMRAVLLQGDACEEELRLLISLAVATRLFGQLYDQDEGMRMRGQVQIVTAREPLGEAVRQLRRSWFTTGYAVPTEHDPFPETPPWARY